MKRILALGALVFSLVASGAVSVQNHDAYASTKVSAAASTEAKKVTDAVNAFEKVLDKKIAKKNANVTSLLKAATSKGNKTKDAKHKSALQAFVKLSKSPTLANLKAANKVLSKLGLLKSASNKLIDKSASAVAKNTGKSKNAVLNTIGRGVVSSNQSKNRIVYVTGGGKSDVYWYGKTMMPKNTNMKNIVQMKESEAIALGKRHSLKE